MNNPEERRLCFYIVECLHREATRNPLLNSLLGATATNDSPYFSILFNGIKFKVTVERNDPMILLIHNKSQTVKQYADPASATTALWGSSLEDYTVHVKGLGIVDLAPAESNLRVVEEILRKSLEEASAKA